MPFSETKYHSTDYWTRHYNKFLKPLIEKTEGVEAFRSEPLKGDIASQIITDLAHSDIVVADLTDHNPNVLWELGVRQSFANGTITIAENGTQIPFHFSHKGILFYNGDHLDAQVFEDQFLKSIKHCLDNPNDPDSPVLEALGGRGTLYGIVHAEENARKVRALRMEINLNERFLNKIVRDCKRNRRFRQNKKGRIFLTFVLLKTYSSELLLTNRYLALDELSYRYVDNYCSWCCAINMKIDDWSRAPENVEKWFIRNEQKFVAAISNMKQLLTKIESNPKHT
jgi:hypothetical protein